MAQADSFTTQYLGKPVEIADPTNLDQCLDWAMAWCQQLSIPIAAITHLYAYQVYAQPTALTLQYFTLVPCQPGLVPPAGALVVFSPAIGGIAGHIALALSGSTPTTLLTSDENWDYKLYIQRVTHTYNFVLGWLMPKSLQGDTMPTAQNVHDYFVTYLGHVPTQHDIDFYVVRPWTELASNVCDVLLLRAKNAEAEIVGTTLAPGTYVVPVPTKP